MTRKDPTSFDYYMLKWKGKSSEDHIFSNSILYGDTKILFYRVCSTPYYSFSFVSHPKHPTDTPLPTPSNRFQLLCKSSTRCTSAVILTL